MISIKEIDDAIREIFDDNEALNVETVYEKEGENYKLILFFHKLYMNEANVLYTKLMFLVDGEKTNLLKNSFMYLYDINCIYRNVEFSDLNEFKEKLTDIFKKEKFGIDIKILSKFMDYPATLINDWLYDNTENVFSVSSIKYSPKVTIIPCKYLSFDFKIEVNNVEIGFTLVKDGKNDYRYEFVFPEGTEKVSKPNLKDFVSTIGLTLKNNIE